VGREKLYSQAGTSLIELVVGSAIAMLVLGAVVGLQVAAYRQSHADDVRYETQGAVALAMERIVQDLRRGAYAEPSGSSLTVEMEDDSGEVSTVHYWLASDSEELMRAEGAAVRSVAQGVVFLDFSTTDDDSTRIVIRARLADGQLYELTSLVAPR